MPDASGGRAALAAAMETRRAELRIKWQDVARRADISIATLGRVRRDEGDLTTDTKYGLEEALRWTRGSIDAVLAGGAPTARESVLAPAPARHEWSAEERRKILAMSLDEVISFGQQIKRTSGERAAVLWLHEAMRLKAEAATIESEDAAR